jgi:hypothetical protein
MADETESVRRKRLAEINVQPNNRESLKAKYGKVWDDAEFAEDFEIIEFKATDVVVRRKWDAKQGSLEYQDHPRFYFNWKPASPRFYFGGQ